ncbi:terminase small subunit [Acinetobacter indicus]|uniref:terminase small subunit n=1 Tax=Acinetobacter indicus TaxID=756892 RepID=UPI001D17BA8F|nr:terminase small subunit [Acinetobacter indicus]
MANLTPKQQRFVEEYLIDLNATQAAIRSGCDFDTVEPIGYYVYLLINPLDDKIFYIGKGKGNRLHSHAKNAKKGLIDNEPKYSKIKEILKSGREPVAIVFESNLRESIAFKIEKELIHRLVDCGLTNISHGTVTNVEKIKAQIEDYYERIIPFDVWQDLITPELKNQIERIFGSVENCYSMMMHALDVCYKESLREIEVK